MNGDPMNDPDYDPTIDPPHDPDLASELRALERSEWTTLDWERVRSSINAAAAPLLARRQAPAPWWQYAAGWATHLIPAGLAATALLAVGLHLLSPGPEGSAETGSSGSPQGLLESILASVLDEPQDPLILTGEDDLFLAIFPAENRDDSGGSR